MIDYEEEWIVSLLFRNRGSLAGRAFFWSLPSGLFSIALLYVDEWWPGFREDMGTMDVNRSQIWAAMTAIAVSMVFFRTRLAWDRFWEGTGLLHQMRGEWFDTVSNCISFSICAKAEKFQEVDDFRHTIIRLMSLTHGAALEEISSNSIMLETIDTFGLNDVTLNHLQECHIKYNFNKVEVMLHLLQSLITSAQDDGVLRVPAPILSRVYQTISRGFVNLLNAKKIQDTKFPFPYVQMITMMLFFLEITVPLMMTSMIFSKVICAIFTMFPIWGLFCLNFIAQELEDPFGTDANDLPLEKFQIEMNNCLIMLLHPNTDLIAGVNDSRCDRNFFNLNKTISTTEHPVEKPGFVRSKTKRLSEYSFTDTSEQSPDGNIRPVVSDNFASGRRGSGDSAGSLPAFAPQVSPWTQGSNNTASAPAEMTGTEDVLWSQSLNLVVGVEPAAAERKSPRVEMPAMNMMVRGGDVDNLTMERPCEPGVQRYDADNNSMQKFADLQPVLAKNMDELMRSLHAWTHNIETQVDNLNSNSTSLREALKRFGNGLPSISPPIVAGPPIVNASG